MQQKMVALTSAMGAGGLPGTGDYLVCWTDAAGAELVEVKKMVVNDW